MATAHASMYNAFHSYVKISAEMEHLLYCCIVGADDLYMRERERDEEQGYARNMIKNRCFRTLILKLVNPLESLEDRIAIHV